MAFVRIAIFAMTAASLFTMPEASSQRYLRIRSPTMDAKKKLKEPVSDPLRLVDGGVSDGSPSPDITLVGQVDEERQQEEAEQGRPIEEDKLPKAKSVQHTAKSTKARVQAVTPAPLAKGMERADASNQKSSGVYNPMTEQVEKDAAALIQVSRRHQAVDIEASDEESEADEAEEMNDDMAEGDEDDSDSQEETADNSGEDEEESVDSEEEVSEEEEEETVDEDEETVEEETVDEDEQEDDESDDAEEQDAEKFDSDDFQEEEDSEED